MPTPPDLIGRYYYIPYTGYTGYIETWIHRYCIEQGDVSDVQISSAALTTLLYYGLLPYIAKILREGFFSIV
jgi:hypothetical protein